MLNVRRAKKEDIGHVRDMIQELADFENMSDGPRLSESDLIRDAGLDGGPEYCEIYVLTKENVSTEYIGYAICFKSYSTWNGRCFFLEDIYVRPQHRQLGAGKHLFLAVAARAKELNCSRLDFHVLEWNPARKFYENLGAKDLTVSEKWYLYRLEGDNLTNLANKYS
ncbi:thialysine N-epsilon-acetyltransferase [Drosophila willistoni]|nr:thialysine N-epsilon-acetyltransferase [Drosophila willistoni]